MTYPEQWEAAAAGKAATRGGAGCTTKEKGFAVSPGILGREAMSSLPVIAASFLKSAVVGWLVSRLAGWLAPEEGTPAQKCHASLLALSASTLARRMFGYVSHVLRRAQTLYHVQVWYKYCRHSTSGSLQDVSMPLT